MELLAAQILAIVLIVGISFTIGSVPIVIGHKFKLTSEKRGGEANVRAQGGNSIDSGHILSRYLRLLFGTLFNRRYNVARKLGQNV